MTYVLKEVESKAAVMKLVFPGSVDCPEHMEPQSVLKFYRRR